MLILAFESSAKAASAALVKDGRLLSQSLQVSGLTHSRTLLPMAEDMLKNAETQLRDVDLIAVAHGPGSFTGVRIGVSTVKGLAWAAEKPCVGVSTLEAMAWHGLAAGGFVCPVMDARRQAGASVRGPRDLAGGVGRSASCTSLPRLPRRRRRLPHGGVSVRRGNPLPSRAGRSGLAGRLGRGDGGTGQASRLRRRAASGLSAAFPGRTRAAGAPRRRTKPLTHY